MQAFSPARSWTSPVGTLGELTAAAVERAAAVVGSIAELRARAADQPPAKPFGVGLRGEFLRVIAEVKRASPSKGIIAGALDASEQARRYAAGGAAAISVLTEPARFGGSLRDLADAAAAVAIPVIRKDFLVHPVQLWEARAAGASAALLIVRSLGPSRLRAMSDSALECGLEALVEIRDEQELDWALKAGARVIGVNNRNLETLEIDVRTAPALIPRIPPDCIAVAESGMVSAADVEPAARAGADAILVGSAVSAAADASEAVRALARVRSVGR